MCPDQGLNPQPWHMGQCFNQLSYQARAFFILLCCIIIIIIIIIIILHYSGKIVWAQIQKSGISGLLLTSCENNPGQVT